MEKQIKKELDERRIKLISAAAVILLLVLVIALVANIVAVGVLKTRENALRAEYQQLTTQNQAMQDEIAKRNTDIYTEQYARDYLGMVKDGEVIVITK